jgi:hypothetical protein
MKTAKLGAIFVISVMALAGTGAAYALWAEDLYIWTDINTGDVDVDWSYITTGTNAPKPWVSILDIYIDASGILRCRIDNAYPCVEYYFYFDLHCVGTIPVHFTPIEYLGDVLPDWVEDYEIFITSIWEPDPNDPDNMLLVESFNPPEFIQWIQLHPGEVAYGYYMVHFNNNLEENTGYTLDFKTQAHQYNELPYGPLNKPAGG